MVTFNLHQSEPIPNRYVLWTVSSRASMGVVSIFSTENRNRTENQSPQPLSLGGIGGGLLSRLIQQPDRQPWKRLRDYGDTTCACGRKGHWPARFVLVIGDSC